MSGRGAWRSESLSGDPETVSDGLQCLASAESMQVRHLVGELLSWVDGDVR